MGTQANASLRRLRMGGWTLLLVVASLAIAIFSNIIASHSRTTFDLSRGSQSLSERTRSILDIDNTEIRLILNADLTRADPATRTETLDTLSLLSRFDHVSVTRIDLGAPNANAAIEAEVAALLSMEQSDGALQERLISSVIGRSESLSTELNLTADALDELTATLDAPDRAQLYEQAALLRVHTDQLAAATQAARQTNSQNRGYPLSGEVASAFQQSPSIIQTASQYASAIQAFADQTRVRSDALNKQESSARARVLLELARSVQAISAELDADLARLTPLLTERVEATLRQSPVLLVIATPKDSPSKVLALDPADLMPLRTNTRFDQSGNTQWILATAIASATDPTPPVVVFTHSEPSSLLSAASRSMRSLELRRFAARMRAQNVEVIEWPTALDPRPPATGAYKAQGRPVVYWVSAGFGDPRARDRGSRRSAHAQAIESLFTNRESLVLNVGPSELPGLGLEDPVARVLQEQGIQVNTSGVLYHSFEDGTISTAPSHTPIDSTQLLARLLQGEPTCFPDAVTIQSAELSSGWSAVLGFNNTNRFWRIARNWIRPLLLQRSSTPHRPFAPQVTVEGDEVDIVDSALLITRSTPDGNRQLVFGSDRWYTDTVALNQMEVFEGRAVNSLQGNAELVAASIYYAAGKDDRVAKGYESRTVSRIPESFSGQNASLVRWLLTLGTPALILLAGVILRPRL